ncbi:hypothetical protein [Rheinheimera sp. WS51]|uniref:hypothetical protein n=1 Tax=Rheinheimera sp. WS51 TaxID=3425886 RepID=UPI003D93DC14
MHTNRRHLNKDIHSFWDDLNFAQKFAVAELRRFGYELLCVRHVVNGNIALLVSGQHIAAIDMEGQIDTRPEVQVRV